MTVNLAESLLAKGYSVYTAYNGVQGYTSYLLHPTEWVITDIQMPTLSGVEMIRSIRVVNPAVRAVYMSGSIEKLRSALVKEEANHGALSLTKPFKFEKLLRMIESARAENSAAGISSGFSLKPQGN